MKINQIIYFNSFYQSEIKKSALLFQRIQGNKLFPNTNVLKYLYLKTRLNVLSLSFPAPTQTLQSAPKPEAFLNLSLAPCLKSSFNYLSL